MAKTRKPKSPPKTPETPSGRQRKYAAAIVSGKSKQQAKREAHYAESTKGKDIERKPAVQSLFTKLLEKAGVTDDLLAKRIYQGLHANVVARETATARREVLVDYPERRGMTELSLKLKGHLIDKHELRMVRTLEEILEDSHG